MTVVTPSSGLSVDKLLNEEQAARLLGLSVRALQGWRSRRCGPPFLRLSNHTIRYIRRDLIEWMEQYRVTPECTGQE